MNNMCSGSKVIVALDYASEMMALDLVERLSPKQCKLKVGKELFTVAGPRLVKVLVDKGFDVFLDLKFHDIPNTVASACKAACDLGVWMLNVHALGGSRMMTMAKEAVENSGTGALLIGVTVLTSHSEEDIHEIGLLNRPVDNVLNLAHMVKRSGLDGVVCSAQESGLVKKEIKSPFLLVTPGIRLKGGDCQDQKRVVTPMDAINNGSDYLVIGRSVTQADDPLTTLMEINKGILL